MAPRKGQTRDQRWAAYEALAHKIVQDLMPYATVTLDDHVPGGQSETSRQIDVSARWTDGSEDYLLIVQARERSRPADVNTIGEFKSVIEDVGASRGVLMCSKGFTKSAITYARNVGISTYSLHDAQSVRWSHELTIPLVWVTLTPHLAVRQELDTRHTGQARLAKGRKLLYSPDGGATEVDYLAIFERMWNGGELDKSIGVEHHFGHIPDQLWFRLEGNDGNTYWEVLRMSIRYTVHREAWLGQFRPSDCRGLIDYLDDRKFIPSFMNLEDLPTQRDESWVMIDNPDEVALRTRGLVITSEVSQVAPGSAEMISVDVTYVGPLGTASPPPGLVPGTKTSLYRRAG